MNFLKNLLLLGVLLSALPAIARQRQGGNNTHHNPDRPPGLRADCRQGTSQQDLDINNVRTTLRVHDVWYDGQSARYIVPNVADGEIEVSSLFAGGIWLGAVAEGGNLIVAVANSSNGQAGVDFFPGPLSQDCNPLARPGFTDQSTCAKWDNHFVVYGAEIDSLRGGGTPSRNLLGWPARGNQNFVDIWGYELPNQNLAPFIDKNGDGEYNAYDGDHPIIEVRGCEAKNTYADAIYADQMIWWVYNDAGNIHQESGGAPMYMEVQALAFAFQTSDELNNMTFYRYKLLNKNNVSVDSTFFSVWSDPDLGNPIDDYVGSDSTRNLGIIYNADPDDNRTGGDAPGYGSPTPALGVDYFRGPLGNDYDYTKPKVYTRDCNGAVVDSAYQAREIGLTSFSYYTNGGTGGTGDPNDAQDHYNLMNGYWADGTCYYENGNGHTGTGNCTKFVFPSDPESAGWSMCSENLASNDFRFLHSTGPFKLLPGATNELITGIVWVPKHLTGTACASFRPLIKADEKAQALFDNCFDILDGPQAPDMEVVEMNQELVLILNEGDQCTKDKKCGLTYEEIDPRSPATAADRTYNFEGYKIYQLANANIGRDELEDPEKARVIYQADVKNGVATIINWVEDEDVVINGQPAVVPIEKVEGVDKGIQKALKVTTDQFAKLDKTLVNHKKYYFLVVAYAYNNYEDFNPDPDALSGQQNAYLEGRKNIKTYTAIPRINTPEYFGMVLNSEYGDGPEITRLDGKGNQGGALEVKDAAAFEAKMFQLGGVNPEITYKGGTAPVSVLVSDPTRVPESDFVLTVFDGEQTDDSLQVADDIRWQLQAINSTGNVEQTWVSQYSLDNDVDQAILDLGLTIKAVQQKALGTDALDVTGFIERSAEFRSGGNFMFTAFEIDGFPGFSTANIFNTIKNKTGEDDHTLDPSESYSTIDTFATWMPIWLADGKLRKNASFNTPEFYLSPLYVNDAAAYPPSFNQYKANPARTYSATNNVNVVITPDKEKWSRCIVVESANAYYYATAGNGLGLSKPDGKFMFDLKAGNSIDKEGNVDGSGTGYGWFPGYAYDVETGQRLNLFFGENGYFRPGNTIWPEVTNGNDLRFNPSDQLFLNRTNNQFGFPMDFTEVVLGGQHFAYVTKDPYDECKDYAAILNRQGAFSTLPADPEARKAFLLDRVSWASMLSASPGQSMIDGTPRGEVCYKMRVKQPFAKKVGTNVNAGYPYYQFSTKGLAVSTTNETAEASALDLINVVPNPYYAYSEYESNETQQIIKITNLPAKCNIKIYSLDGRFIREYKRDLTPSDVPGWRHDTPDSNLPYIDGAYQQDNSGNFFYQGTGIENQIVTSQEWDLKNAYSVPVSSGVYLIYVEVPGVGTRTLKSFIINRAYDAQRL